MFAPDQIQIEADDVISTLTAQRNAALDEIVKQAAIIRALQKRLQGNQESTPVAPPDEPVSGV